MISSTQQIITNGVMTGTATVTSSPFWIGTCTGVCLQAIWTGTATGSIKLQASNAATRPTLDAGASVAVPSNSWTDVASSTYSVTAAGNYLWNIGDAYYPWVRVVYVNATNTGSLQVTATAKSNEVLG